MQLNPAFCHTPDQTKIDFKYDGSPMKLIGSTPSLPRYWLIRPVGGQHLEDDADHDHRRDEVRRVGHHLHGFPEPARASCS